MIPYVIPAIVNNLKRREPSPFRRGKQHKRISKSLKNFFADLFLIALAVLSAGFGLRGFLLPNNFIDGGAVGISLLITETAGFYLPLVLILVNTPFILLGIRIMGTWFAIKTAITIGLLALAVAFIPYPEMTQDKLLVAGFGGFFLGAGIGLAVRGGCVIDGTEVMAIFMSRKTGLTIGDVILIINIIIFSFAAYLLSVETAMYAVLTYLAASKTVDFIIEGIEEYTGVTIISHKQEAIKDVITNELGRGFTIYKGERGFGKKGKIREQVDIIYTVVTRLEVSKLKGEVEKIDPDAFIIMHSIIDTKGGMIKKRRLKH
jgi:uncharacterized membrane-anchored protein YitT (DUF2179 family)